MLAVSVSRSLHLSVVLALTLPTGVTGESLELAPVLSEVEVAPNTGDVWIGGECGRIWTKSAAGGWVEAKSGTDAQVVGLSFVPDGAGARGFVGAFRDSDTQQCITTVQ